jgi:hypothetical protein
MIQERFILDRRPDEFKAWLGRRNYSAIPHIKNYNDFGLELLAWWHALQPEWRLSANAFPKAIYTGPSQGPTDWACLRKCGKDGLILAILGFAWWGRGPGVVKSARWRTAALELRKALEAIAVTRKW